MKKMLICALALLCVVSFAKAEDELVNTASGNQSDTNALSEEGVKDVPSKTVTPTVLNQSNEPYMILIDGRTGGRINVWRNRSRSSIFFHHRYRYYYYVDYPWIVRVPKKLKMIEGLFHSFGLGPKVEGGYYLYEGMYLASEPEHSVDQVRRELERNEGIMRVRGVYPIIPKKVTLSCPSIPGIQVIGFSNKGDAGDYTNSLLDLIIAVPANDKENFEKLYKDGGFYLQKEQVLVFRDSEGKKSERTFTSKVVRLPDHGIVTNIEVRTYEPFECNSANGADQYTVFTFTLPAELSEYQNKKKGEGVDIQLLQGVTVTYSDGYQEVYTADELPVGVSKVFGTLKLEYTETKDKESGNVVAGQLILTDLLANQAWYKGNQKTKEEALMKSAAEKNDPSSARYVE